MFGNDHQQKTNAKAQLDDVLLYSLKMANGGLQKGHHFLELFRESSLIAE